MTVGNGVRLTAERGLDEICGCGEFTLRHSFFVLLPLASLPSMSICFAINNVGVLRYLPNWLVQVEGKSIADCRLLPDKLAREPFWIPDFLIFQSRAPSG